MQPARILAGDVGGTNSRIGFFDAGPTGVVPLWKRVYPSRTAEGGLAGIVRKALADSELVPAAASFGVAGPVREGRCKATNLPWVVDAAEIAEELGLRSVGLVNDLVANAHGLAALGPEEWDVLRPGAPGASGNQALIAAGTGLGMAGLVWDGERHRPFASEGGHASFAPENALQRELASWLAERHGRVSRERVLSGPGLVNVYRFLAEIGRGVEPRGFLPRLEREGAAAITATALERSNRRAEIALEIFAAIYGAEAGNLALEVLATGGVWLGGGIAPLVVEFLSGKGFTQAFLGKGRMRELLEGVPVRVVMNDQAALLGAARHAAASLRGGLARAA